MEYDVKNNEETGYLEQKERKKYRNWTSSKAKKQVLCTKDTIQKVKTRPTK